MSIANSKNKSGIVVAVVFIAWIFISLIIALLMGKQYKKDISIYNGVLTINSFIYKTKIPLDQIDIESISIVNMKNGEYKIGRKINGINSGINKIGWFLVNGKKSKLYLDDLEKVLVIYTNNGDVLYLSVKEPEIILRQLKE